MTSFFVYVGRIIEQVALNKLSLLLKIILQNTQTLQLFMKIIKTESMYKSYLAWVHRLKSLIKRSEEPQALYGESGKITLIKVKNVS